MPEGYVHGNGGKMPPLDLIEEWVRRKGITGRGGETPRQLAYLIARKIARNGLPARPFVWPAYQATVGPWEADMRRILTEITSGMGKPGKVG